MVNSATYTTKKLLNKRTLKLLVELEWPEELNVLHMREYVRAAVQHWGAQFGPDDPLGNPDKNVSVKVFSTHVGEALKRYRKDKT